MSKDLYIQDTAEVFITSLETGNVIGVGYAQTAGFEQTTEETDIRGGIGNKLAYTIRSSKDVELTVTSATFKPEFLEMMQGNEFKEATMDVTRMGTVKVADDAGTLKFELDADLADLQVIRVVGKNGKQADVELTVGEGEIDASFGYEDGEEIEFYYLESVTGRALEIDSKKFGSKVKVEYNTICYDREKATVYSDLYFIFPECIPSGNYGMTFQNGEAFIPEMVFKTTAPKGSDVIGTKLEVIREEQGQDTP